MMNRILPLLVSVAVLALAAFGWAAWSGQPLPTAALYPDPPPLVLAPGVPPDRGDGPAALACPPGLCAGVTVDVESPVLPVAPDALFATVRALVVAQPLVRVVAEDAAAGRLDVVQRTPILGFPESVALRVVAVGEGASSVILLSRSRPGAWDLGDNAARVRTWIAALERASR
ncbi:DUF1499 domain-containing protein [Pararhodospirillum photometricum]|nr:DUF1499 domain-containing protein [Pararhodospirillum photometricum]